MNRLILIVALFGVSVWGISAVWAAPPATLIESCDYAINEPGNYALGTDLTCGSNGVVINATRVKLYLDGNTLTGGSGTGVLVQSGSRIAIMGPGRITGFNVGVGVVQTDNQTINKVKVSGLIVDHNQYGMSAYGANVSGVEIGNNIIADTELDGVRVSHGAFDNTIERNEILESGLHGIFIVEGDTNNNTVAENNVSYNGGHNIFVGAGASGTVVDGNIAIYGVSSDIYDVGTNSMISNNTCFVGDTCPGFSDFDIEH